MISLRNVWLILFIALFYTTSRAQSGQTASHDSVNSGVMRDYDVTMSELEKTRFLDSLHLVVLEGEVSRLGPEDIIKREQLLREISAIRRQDSTRLSQNKEQLEKLRKKIKGYPVLGFFDDTLFYIYSKAGMMTAPERATAITARVKKLGSVLMFRRDSLKVVANESTTDLMFRDEIILAVNANDGIWNNLSQKELAFFARDVIAREVEKYKDASSLSTIAKESAMALLLLAIVVLILKYTGKLFAFIGRWIIRNRQKYFHGVHIGNYELFDVRRQLSFIIGALRLVKWIVIILIIYTALPLLFGIFPWTENLADMLIGYITDPAVKILMAIYGYLPNLFTILVVVFFFKYVLKALKFMRFEIEHERLKIDGFYADWAGPTYQIIRVLLLAFLLVVIFPYLPGSQSPVFKGVSVFLGFLLTFGSASSLSNIISGLVLTYMRLFKIGDRIKIGDITGDVIEKSLLVTRVKTPKNEIVSIPNSSIMNNHTINYTTEAEEGRLIIYTTVTIGYDVPWHQMHGALIEAAIRTEDILNEPAPYVLQTGLEDFYVSYQINAYISQASRQSLIYSVLHQNIQDVCAERNIEIMSPHYRAERDGNAVAIPSVIGPDEKKRE